GPRIPVLQSLPARGRPARAEAHRRRGEQGRGRGIAPSRARHDRLRRPVRAEPSVGHRGLADRRRRPSRGSMIVAERDEVAVWARRPLSAAWRRALTPARFMVAVTLAGAVSAAIWRALPRPLSVRTDIVGSPIHSNYNIELLMQ